jgi:MATE family multidrug resistance protein
MAVFIAFDAMYLTFTGALKGAGDTRFIMWSNAVVSLIVIILPLTFIIKYKGGGLFTCWAILTLYVISLSLVSYLRYRQGKWKNIRVI